MRRSTLTAAFLSAFAAVAVAQDFQIGSRAKGMGGSYTSFENDPVSIWMNPAGIATLPSQMTISYQSYTQYEVDSTKPDRQGEAELGLVSPPLLPSFLGFVFQLGTTENPLAIGVAYMRPVHLRMTYDSDPGGDDGVDEVDFLEEQEFTRFRFCLAYTFRLRDAGVPGLFTHVSLSGAWDLGYTEWSEHAVTATTTTLVNSDRNTKWAGGVGVLFGVYDNTDDLKITVGAAFNSSVEWTFQVSKSAFPVWTWPKTSSVGVTADLLHGYPLRVTFDLQWIDWSTAVAPSAIAGHPNFRSVTNFSLGAEFRIKIRDGALLLYPRIGYRRVSAPWSDPDRLPAVGEMILYVDTHHDVWNLLTIGGGLYWSTQDGRTRGLEFGHELFGESTFNLSFGYTMEF